MMLLELFLTFMMIGLVSFGGGYAMIPLIEYEVTNRGWLTIQEFTDVIAIAGMSPGPIATNSAIFVGYKTAGLVGAVVSTMGMVIPSLVIIIVIATFFYKMHHNKYVTSAFYGLKPIITGLILYSAIRFAYSNGVIGEWSWQTAANFAIFAISLFAMLRLQTHPLTVIMLSGLVGVVLYA
jgi:chromate transporter